MNMGIITKHCYSYYIFFKRPKTEQTTGCWKSQRLYPKHEPEHPPVCNTLFPRIKLSKMATKAYKGDIGIMSTWKDMAQPEGAFLFPIGWPELPSLSTVDIQGQSIPSCSILGSNHQIQLVLSQV